MKRENKRVGAKIKVSNLPTHAYNMRERREDLLLSMSLIRGRTCLRKISRKLSFVRNFDESILGPTLGPHAPQGPSSIKGPITRSMLRKIQMSFSQDDQNPHGLQMLFSWAKEDFKI